MAKSKTTTQIIADIKNELSGLETRFKYEGVAEIKRLRDDLTTLETTIKVEYAKAIDFANLVEKVNNILKYIYWVITIVMGAIILAVVQLVLRSPKQ